jgi:hypothetical protein
MINPGAGLGTSKVWGRIHDAAKEDDVDLLIDIVEARNGAPTRDINLQSATGLTPLHVAALSGSNGCVSYLLARNASLEIIDSVSRLAIHWAAESGQTETVMHLVSAGQNLNLQDQNGNTPLHLAACNGHITTGQYLVEIGALISLQNERSWTPHQAATVPLLRAVMEMLEQTLSDVNQVRRVHDFKRIEDFLENCGMERYLQNVGGAGYTAAHLFDSCKPIHLSKLNHKITNETDKMSHRDYLLFLEALQSYQGTDKTNPFHEAAKRHKRFDDNPELYQAFLADNPNYDINSFEDSEYRRKILPQEKEFMEFMMEVLKELKKNDKHNYFDDIIHKIEGESIEQALMFPDIQTTVDSGWKSVNILDFNQIEQNIKDGMYQCWEQFQADCFIMICNVWIFCRAVQSDNEPSFRAAVALSIRAMRIFKKHNNALKRKQDAFHSEARQRKESYRKAWGKIEADKRLRGFLPDRYKERLLQADEDGDSEFKRHYSLRFAKTSQALAHWGYNARNAYEISRCAWEEDERCARDHRYMLRMLDLTSSRDVGRHFQHPAEDHRSDMHKPGGEIGGPFTVEGYLREIVWPMDFSTMRVRLGAETERDHLKLHPDTYYCLEQVQLDWLIIVFNAVIYHNKFHLEVKRAFDLEQRPPFSVPRAPCSVRLDEGEPKSYSAKILWNQPKPKEGEVITGYEIQIHALEQQEIDPTRTLAVPGEDKRFRIDIPDAAGVCVSESEASKQLINLKHSVITAKSGEFDIVGLCPATSYIIILRSIGMGEIFSPKSGPALRVTTKPAVPEAPSQFLAVSITFDQVVFEWAAPRDNGAYNIDYEVEYTDLTFEKTFHGRVGWDTTTFSTSSVLREPDSSEPLSPGLFLPYQDNCLRPATMLKARVRARNSQGWGPWNQEGFCYVRMLSSNPQPPRALSVVAEGFEYLDIAWLPPLWSNCVGGLSRYVVEILYEDIEGDGDITRLEFDILQLMQSMSDSIHYRPPSRLQHHSRSSQSSRRSSSLIAGRSRPGTGSSTASSDFAKSLMWLPVAEEHTSVQHEDAILSEEQIEHNTLSPMSWWKNTEFWGKVWFTNQVPRAVLQKASSDYPIVNKKNNLLIYQELGSRGWEQEISVVIPPGPYDPMQLANKTQSVLQSSVPLNSSLRWNVFVQDDRFNFVMNRRFRMTMAGTLAYAFGLVLNNEGWIISPEVCHVGMSSFKSIVMAPNTHKLETVLCDLVPTALPFIQRVAVLPGHTIQIVVRSENTNISQEEIWKSSSDVSELLRYQVIADLPSPPTNLQAKGVLASEIVVSWTNSLQHYRPGEEVIHLELFYSAIDGVEEVRYISPLHEGYCIGALHPGQEVKNIRIRCVNKLGPGHCSGSIAARTTCVVPNPPFNFHFTSANSSSICFAWCKPEFNGGSEILEWEVSGFLPDGSLLKDLISDTDCVSYTFSEIQPSTVGVSLLDVSVRCRNEIGWSKKSNKAQGKCNDSPSLYTDTRHDRMNIKIAGQKLALERLTEAITIGHNSIMCAETAAHQPARFKKCMMEEAENAVILSEYRLQDAIIQSEAAGIKDMGIMQHKADVDARELLQTLQNKRTKRWGASNRGLQV